MRRLSPLALGLLAFALLAADPALADRLRPGDVRPVERGEAWEAQMRARAPQTGNCRTGVAERDLDINNVRARMYNIGNLFWRDGDPVYVVPANGNVSSIFAGGIWIGGRVDGEIRMAGATYAQGNAGFEFWPGPLNNDGSLPFPNDCARFDRLYKVSRADILEYEQTGIASPDLRDWPVELGAPVIDGDGNPDNYNLAGGDRPDIVGDQGIWWVMNDVGNVHRTTGSLPIGLEVQVLAFAFARSDALNDITFYRYKIIYKGSVPLEDTYMALFSDPDVGEYTDDYIGSDPELGLGFAYNARPVDGSGGAGTYGTNPPAVGYNFFRGPITDATGDGVLDTLGMTVFTYYNNGGGAQGDPTNAQEYYNYMSGFWRDGVPVLFGGDGRNAATGGPTSFVYPNDPPNFWSEFCINGTTPGTRDGCTSEVVPADRRFVMSSGPFTMNPGESQEIVYGIVWAQGPAQTSAPHLESVQAMKRANVLAQTAFDIDFELAPPPDPPQVQAVNLDGQAVITWSYAPTSNNYLGQFAQADPLLRGQVVADSVYRFQGFNIYRFPTASFNPTQAELVATYDIIDGVTTIIDVVSDPVLGPTPFVAARGTDSGIQYYHVVEGLTNYTDYYFGVSAYAYNEESVPKVLESPISPIAVRPARITAGGSGASAAEGQIGQFLRADLSRAIGGGTVRARIVDPLAIRAATYEVEFVQARPAGCPDPLTGARTEPIAEALQALTRRNLEAGLAATERLDPPRTLAARGGESQDCTPVLTYILRRVVNGVAEIILDGRAYYAETGRTLPIGADFFLADGLSFTVFDEAPNPLILGETDAGQPIFGFTEVRGPGGADPCAPNAAGFQPFGCQDGHGVVVYGNTPLALNSTGEYAVFNSDRVLGDPDAPPPTSGSNPGGPEVYLRAAAPRDFEIRFTETGSIAVSGTGIQRSLVRVPFEVWDVGPVNAFQENDPSNDVQLIVTFVTTDATPAGRCQFAYGDGFNYANPSGAGSRFFTFQFPGEPQPRVVPGTPAINAVEVRPGRTYADFAAAAEAALGGADCGAAPLAVISQNVSGTNSPIQKVVFLDVLRQSATPEGARTPPQGVVIRFNTTKPIQAGDIYAVDATPVAYTPDDAAVTDSNVLALIGATPNPYRGQSAYENDNLDRVIRFVNLPDQATIRVFTLAGTLIRTLEKSDPTSRSLDWDLVTQNGLPVASGIYLAHVETAFGNKVIKLGVVNRRIQLQTY